MGIELGEQEVELQLVAGVVVGLCLVGGSRLGVDGGHDVGMLPVEVCRQAPDADHGEERVHDHPDEHTQHHQFQPNPEVLPALVPNLVKYQSNHIVSVIAIVLSLSSKLNSLSSVL